MNISLIKLLELDNPVATQPATSPIVAANPAGQEVNVGMDFTNFEKTIASYTENTKNLFQTKLLNLVGNKKVFLRGSKGYGQPIKDYTINVKNVSIDFYYERYVIVLKDDDDKEYFLEPGYKMKILGPAEQTFKKSKEKKPKDLDFLAKKAAPAPAPAPAPASIKQQVKQPIPSQQPKIPSGK